MVLISASGLIITSVISKEQNSSKRKIVTSFYPMYIITTNIVEGVDDIEIVNLTDYETGCLHDYQLTTSDMKKLENADTIIMNGGGMEGFVEEVFDSYPNVPIIDSSMGIPLLSGTGHDHDHDDDHDEDDDDHGEDSHEGHNHEYNAHIWMNMDHYIKQVENVAKDLSDLDPANSRIYESNSIKYIEEIRQLQDDYKSRLIKYKDIPIIIFHDAFAYLADELGLNVVHIINMDENTHLSAGEIREIIDKINEHNVEVLLTEAQYSVSIAETISSETDSKVYIVDSIVSGTNTKDAYINAMRDNIEMLEKAYEEAISN